MVETGGFTKITVRSSNFYMFYEYNRLFCRNVFFTLSAAHTIDVELNWLFNVTINDISVIYVTACSIDISVILYDDT